MTLKTTTAQWRSEAACGFGVLGFALVFPTLMTWAYFILLADGDPTIQQTAYSVGKVVQFGLPVCWVLWILRTKIQVGRPGPGLPLAALFGLVVGGSIYALYHLWLVPSGSLEGTVSEVREKVEGIGIDSKFKFAVMGIGYSLFHSFLEEYYWRWFVFKNLRRRTSLAIAVTVSSLGFMAHHVIVLGTYFGWDSPLSYLTSIGVAVGGAVWALLYNRTGSLYGPWLSHCLVDAAIFLVGFEMMYSS